jgi:hypothetical protein
MEHGDRHRLEYRDALACDFGWWAWQDLNLGPHPYQAYSRGCVPAARALGDQVIADMSLTVVIRSVPDLTV